MIPSSFYSDLYQEFPLIVHKIYHECKLVHADLSEYNILYRDSHLYVVMSFNLSNTTTPYLRLSPRGLRSLTPKSSRTGWRHRHQRVLPLLWVGQATVTENELSESTLSERIRFGVPQNLHPTNTQ